MPRKIKQFVGVVGRERCVETANFSLRKAEIFDRRNRRHADGTSPMEDAYRILKSIDPDLSKTVAIQAELAQS
jgi:hypothetical protein